MGIDSASRSKAIFEGILLFEFSFQPLEKANFLFRFQALVDGHGTQVEFSGYLPIS